MVVHSPSKSTTTPWPALLPMGALAGKPPVPIARPATLVGSRQTANLRLHSSTVSKAHALILSSESKVHIRDLNSRNKVFVNGKEVRGADLREGDQVKIGRFTFRFTAGPKINSTARRRTVPAGQLETDEGDVVLLNQRVVVIGQRAGCDLVLASPNVSTTHAAIYDVNGRRYIMDLGSRNGTLVNNQKTLQVELKIGDVIDIGGTEVRYAAGEGVAAPAQDVRVRKEPQPAAAPAAAEAQADPDELLALESLNETPAPPKPSGQSKIFAPPPQSLPDDSNAPIPIEDEVKLPEPTETPEEVAEISEPIPEPASSVSEQDIAAEKAAEDELMALLDETPLEPEIQAEAKPEPPPQPQAEAEPQPQAEAQAPAEPVAAIAPQPEEIAPEPETIPVEAFTPEAAGEPIDQVPPALEEESLDVEQEPIAIEPAPEPVAETSPQIQPEPQAEEEPIIVEPTNEGEIVGTATANVDVVPQPLEEVAAEVREAATAFEDELPPAPVAQEAAEFESEPEAIAPPPQETVVEPEPLADADIEEFLEPQPQEEAPPAQEAVVPPPVEEPPVQEASVEEAPIEEPPPVEEAPVEEAPVEEAPLEESAVQQPPPPPPPPPVVPAIPEPQLAAPLPPTPPPPAPKPRWIAAPTSANSTFTPTLLTIKQPAPQADFDLDDLLGEKKHSTPAQEAAPVEEAKQPSHPEPLELAPPIVQEEAAGPESSELVPPPSEPSPAVEEVPVPEFLADNAQESTPVADEPNLDDLALAALDEAAPPRPTPVSNPHEAQATATVAEPLGLAEPPLPPEPPPTVATTSTAIVPEPEPEPQPSAAPTSSIEAADEDAADLLEELPDEPQTHAVSMAESPILSSATAPPEVEEATQAIEEPATRDVFSLGQRRAAASAAPVPHQRSIGSSGRIPPRPRSSGPIPPRWGPLATAVATEVIPQSSPRRARKKLSVLLVLMFVAMVLAALAVWKFVLPRVIVQGTIRFDNAANLRGDARDSFANSQLALLNDDKVRASAEGLFRIRKPAAAGFFIEQDFRDPQLKRQWVNNGDRSELQITYKGTDPMLDPERLFCLLQAIYDANSSSVSTAAAASKTVEQKRMAVVTARAELNKVRERRGSLEAIVRPDPAELSAAQAEVDKLDAAWTQALAARKAIAADIEHLAQPAESASTGTASDGDSALKLMSEKMSALNGRLAEAKTTAAKAATDARKLLNASIEDFQTSIGVAQGMMKDNPALAAYISSAQRLHEASWKLQGDLIERQERQQKQLVEYKKRLEEQVEAHKREMLEKDDGLKELNHLLDMKRRELNALSATGGLKRDVEKLRSDVATLQERIMARTVAVGEDKFYQDAISGLKQIIDSVQGQLAADRAASEKLMNDLETKFRNTSPEIETLPDAQRSLAARLANQVNSMQTARKKYTEAVQAQDADANDRLKELQAEAAALESDIALRRKELVAEQQKKLTEQQSAQLHKKQAELAGAEKAERAARDAYRQKIKELDILVDRDRAYGSTREELARIVQQDEPLKADQVSATERAFAVAQRAANSAIAPQPPSQPRILDATDYRFAWGIGAVLIVGLVFGAAIFFTSHSEPNHRHNPQANPISA